MYVIINLQVLVKKFGDLGRDGGNSDGIAMGTWGLYYKNIRDSQIP